MSAPLEPDGPFAPLSYLLPVRAAAPLPVELLAYLRWLNERPEIAEVLVVDGSAPGVFALNQKELEDVAAHVPVDEDVRAYINGKVAGVVTGLRQAACESVIIADDDVRYDQAALSAMQQALERADVVRPQNYFDPLPWHAWLDTGRTLINRVAGGDWPGTLGLRRSLLVATGGYDGNVLFENLELVRTVVAAGGTERVPLDLYVRRLPPTAQHFWSQRVRQAYDEFARPTRMAASLAILPAAVGLLLGSRGRWIATGAAAAVGVAEIGRRRAGGAAYFPPTTSAAAPLWLLERAVSAWIALGSYLVGGVPYRGRIVRRAATPLRELRQRFARALPSAGPPAGAAQYNPRRHADAQPASAVDDARAGDGGIADRERTAGDNHHPGAR